jgi:hypothetical protein
MLLLLNFGLAQETGVVIATMLIPMLNRVVHMLKLKQRQIGMKFGIGNGLTGGLLVQVNQIQQDHLTLMKFPKTPKVLKSIVQS